MKKIRTIILIVATASALLFLIGGWKLYTSNISGQNRSAEDAVKRAHQSYTFNHVKSVVPYNGTEAYQVIQAERNGQDIYIWVPDHPKRAPFILRAAHAGITKKEALQKLSDKRLDVKKIISIRLGAINGNPVWEITFLNSGNNYNYVSFYFNDGKEAQRILDV
ncbi:DUF5590 domain-containing protein [Sporolactobacillus sp. CPB3-1]|uniref:DUF5590 domain-containing protein n=1 Tax=Sporolactobacillus mangiferae TaxID=2940498 RepID=A0ABT0MCL4_9BACL|nr:DUF5590 domain-containing protein [Sporolactobacillus mangiferae]MCL1632609.1 DUF5590 domain-containing protein [Sporolactobacillus mangiferae]